MAGSITGGYGWPVAGSGMPWLAASLGITGFDTKVKESKDLRTGWEPQLTTANNLPAPEAKVHKDRAKWVKCLYGTCVFRI